VEFPASYSKWKTDSVLCDRQHLISALLKGPSSSNGTAIVDVLLSDRSTSSPS
jgi:hypothetical protein